MTGDWIKVRNGFWMSPAFNHITRITKCDDFELLYALIKLTGWFKVHSKYGKVKTTTSVPDSIAGVKGLSNALLSVDWMRNNDGVLSLHHFCVPMANRKILCASIRKRVLAAGSCAACGRTDRLEVDHKIPIVRGGSCEESNLHPLCYKCNRAKGRMTWDEFRKGAAVK
jgi:hypothetical protein